MTEDWHSLHRRDSMIHVGPKDLEVDRHRRGGLLPGRGDAGGAGGGRSRANTDLHLHEAMARWSGWSLSAPMVGTHLTRSGDPEDALPDPDDS